jgi:two-component system cell cycle response regulator DivK
MATSTVSSLGGRPTTALLVDRDADTRTMYAEFLQRSRYNTDEAEDGREALAKAISLRPDVIVTETRLPGINGYDLCELLHKDVATRAIPVIFVTGDAFAGDVRHAADAGADAVLIKPCLPQQLLSEIRRLLSASLELRERGDAVRERLSQQIVKSDRLIEKSHANIRRVTLSRALNRRDTTTPPMRPPSLVCPVCDQPLRYVRSHVGGVSVRHLEQWDYFECSGGCGTFQYRERTKKLRSV